MRPGGGRERKKERETEETGEWVGYKLIFTCSLNHLSDMDIDEIILLCKYSTLITHTCILSNDDIPPKESRIFVCFGLFCLLLLLGL